MGWHGPQHCIDNCCDITVVPPCEKPVVNCRKYEIGYGVGGFEYEVENAETAWIGETCTTTTGAETITVHPIELDESGNASGVFPVQANCRYCVVARNFCGQVFCCDICDQPICTLGATLHPDGSVTFNWTYETGPFGDPITVATLNGVDILGGSFVDSGTLTIAKADLPDVVTMFIANDCGKSRTCTFNVPCCWTKQQLRISFDSVGDIFRTCSQTYTGWLSTSGNTLMAYDAEIEWTGLTALEGTYLFDVPTSNCVADLEQEYYIGNLNARWFWRETVRGARFPMGGLQTETATYELQINGIELYLRANGLYLKLPATGTSTQTGREVNFGSLVDPSFTDTVALRNNIKYFWMGISGVCPQRYATGLFQVTGINSSAGSFGGWITGITGPGAAPFFINPDVGVVTATNGGLTPPWCPNIRDNHPISYEAEYLV